MRHLLQTAAEAGVGLIATRPDGDADKDSVVVGG